MTAEDIKKVNKVQEVELMKKEGPQGTDNQPSEGERAEGSVDNLATQGLQEALSSQPSEDAKDFEDLSEQLSDATEETNDKLEELGKQVEALKVSNNLGSTALKKGAVLGTAGAVVGIGGLGLAPIIGMQYADDPRVVTALEAFKNLEDGKWDGVNDQVLSSAATLLAHNQDQFNDLERKMTRNFVDGQNNLTNHIEFNRDLIHRLLEGEKARIKLLNDLKKELYEQQEDNRKLRRDLHNSVEFLGSLIKQGTDSIGRKLESLEDDHYVLKEALDSQEDTTIKAVDSMGQLLQEYINKEINAQDERNAEAGSQALYEVKESAQQVKNDILVELGTDIQDIKSGLSCYDGKLMQNTDIPLAVKSGLLKSPLCSSKGVNE